MDNRATVSRAPENQDFSLQEGLLRAYLTGEKDTFEEPLWSTAVTRVAMSVEIGLCRQV